MQDDQVELLTHQKNQTHSGDVRNILDNLPVTSDRPSAKIIKNTITRETEEPPTPGESPFVEAFLVGLNWASYAIAIVAAMVLAWVAADGIIG